MKKKVAASEYFFFLVSTMLLFSSSSTQSKCMVKFDISVCSAKLQSHDIDAKCHKEPICRKDFNASYVKIEPYSTMIVRDVLRTCCGKCAKVSVVETFQNINQVPANTENASDFIFPILGRSSAQRLYGYYFIPLVEPPSIYYFTAIEEDVVIELIKCCFDMWPLLLICVILIAISGFIGWCLETSSNKEQFPRPFLNGWFEGCWWSFVSMTTVGYGDKVPKSAAARIFSVVWILVGITIFSLITAMLSSEITRHNSPSTPEIAGAKVGALRHRTYDTFLIAKLGGHLVEIPPTNESLGIVEMIRMLRRKEIDGFILDRFTLIVFYRHLKRAAEHRTDLDYLRTKTIRTEKSYTGEKLSYGMLVKNLAEYEFLVDFVRDNQQVINTCNELLLNDYSREVHVYEIQNPLFDVAGGMFWPSMITVSIIMALIVIFGIVYEYKRRNASPEKMHV